MYTKIISGDYEEYTWVPFRFPESDEAQAAIFAVGHMSDSDI